MPVRAICLPIERFTLLRPRLGQSGINPLHVAAWYGPANVLKRLLSDDRVDPTAAAEVSGDPPGTRSC